MVGEMIVAAAKSFAALRAGVPVVVTAKVVTVAESIAALSEPPAMIAKGFVSEVPVAKSAAGSAAAEQEELVEGIGTTAGEAATLAALT